MKKAIITTWLIWPLLSLAAGAQTLTLEQCVSSAMANHPTSRKVPLIMQVEQVNRQLINQSSLPVVILNAQASWQSDVVNFTLDLPFPVTFPVIPKDQYKVTVDVQQMLYDGGVRQIRQSLNTQETTIKNYY
ncbi:MAG: hypothetical protein J7L89_08815 [Bacteroidales bacterium]|nr:hypothetical protein [Bacteroidales bacterium]